MTADVLIPSSLLDLHGSYYRSFISGAHAFTNAFPTSPRVAESLFGIGFLQKKDMGASNNAVDPSHYSAIYLLSGRGHYQDDSGFSAALMPGAVFQRLPGRKHTVTFDPKVRYVEVFLAFSSWLLEPLVRILGLEQRPVVYLGLDVALVRDLATAMQSFQAIRESDLPRVYLQHLGLLTALFSRSQQVQTTASINEDWIDEACRLLADEATGRAPLARIAKRLEVSYEVFRKEFRERMGISPGDYRIRRRLDRARELLVSTPATITDIAEQLGYPNASVFSLQFKGQVGRSPEHYRRRNG